MSAILRYTARHVGLPLWDNGDAFARKALNIWDAQSWPTLLLYGQKGTPEAEAAYAAGLARLKAIGAELGALREQAIAIDVAALVREQGREGAVQAQLDNVRRELELEAEMYEVAGQMLALKRQAGAWGPAEKQ